MFRLASPLVLAGLCACFAGLPSAAPPDAGMGTGDAPTLCETDNDCDGWVCQAGVCVAPTLGCTDKSECEAGLVCVTGACAAPPEACNSSQECPGTSLCDGFTHTCFDPSAPGCQSNAECASAPGCDASCVCREDGSCGPDEDLPPDEPVVPSDGPPLGLGGYTIENRENMPPSQLGVIPDGLMLSPGQHLVISRDADRASFESYWQVSLGPNVLFWNAQAGSAGIPIINGNEKWALLSPSGSLVDETELAGSAGNAYLRTNAARDASGWTEVSSTEATPGRTLLPASGLGLLIAQWSDAQGSGNYVYEFIELVYAP